MNNIKNSINFFDILIKFCEDGKSHTISEKHLPELRDAIDALKSIDSQQAEKKAMLEHIKCLESENHKMQNHIEKLHEKYKNTRLETIDEAAQWMLSLFQRNESTIHLSKAAILHWYGHQHASLKQYIDRVLGGALDDNETV